ncbi:HPr family phosphocarrier protein [Tautonia plasticadhaerens]|uniref:Phosphocarrier protein HPr n=1 Tax=Tautonia plasticadhaerens TaxID=2527974 RepID=A0A518HFG4_9BACT|nr:HPr family phosphocarrier protein [Tautonia plasticadhaerens]QDV39589.1 Phosphocarrier protein HPr [Tautonia plasticadhaerens]
MIPTQNGTTPGPGGPVHRRFEVTDPAGLHLRAAARLAQAAAGFVAEVRVRGDGRVADARSILDLMMLAADCGSRLDLEARGADAEAAARVLADLVGATRTV